MKKAEQELLKTLGKSPLLVWGARMTGIGFLRFAGKHALNVVGVADSDASLCGRKLSGLTISLPAAIPALKAAHKGLRVLIAVSIKEDEIIGALAKLGIPAADCVRYSEFCGSFFTIDVTGTCNLRCPSCAYTVPGIKNPAGLMSYDDYVKITDKMMGEAGLVSHICLYSWGEPFLHPDLPRFIERTHALGIAAAVSTNLSIESAEKIENVIKLSPDYLKISTSGFYPEAYNSTHTGGNVDLVKSNLYRIKYFIEKHKAHIFVDVNYHMYRNNVGKDLEKMQEFCDDLGFVLSPCYANVTPVERLVNYHEGKVDAATRKFLDLLLVSLEKGREIAEPYRGRACRFLSNQVNINWDRSVPLCCVCFDMKTATISKDYLKDSLAEINRRKERHVNCVKCMKYAIPPYLMGVNQAAWKKEADRVMRADAAREKKR